MVGNDREKTQFTLNPQHDHRDIIYDTLKRGIHTFTVCYEDPRTHEWIDVHWDDPKPAHPLAYSHRFYKEYKGPAHTGYSIIDSSYLHNQQLAPIISTSGFKVEELRSEKTVYRYSCCVKILNQKLMTAYPCHPHDIADETIYSNVLGRVFW